MARRAGRTATAGPGHATGTTIGPRCARRKPPEPPARTPGGGGQAPLYRVEARREPGQGSTAKKRQGAAPPWRMSSGSTIIRQRRPVIWSQSTRHLQPAIALRMIAP